MFTATLVAAVQLAGWSVSPHPATVGDTVLLTRRIAADATVQVRVPPLEATLEVEPLLPPVVGYAEGSVTVRYALAFFAPGSHTVPFPDIELVHADGSLERIPGDTARLTISSVLPVEDSLPEPRPLLEPLRRSERRGVPLIALAGSTLMLSLLWGGARRRVRPRPDWSLAGEPSAGPPLTQWVEAGELRAVAAAASAELRGAIQRAVPRAGPELATKECLTLLQDERPHWPLEELGDLFQSLDRVRFAPVAPSDMLALVVRSENVRRTWTALDDGEVS